MQYAFKPPAGAEPTAPLVVVADDTAATHHGMPWPAWTGLVEYAAKLTPPERGRRLTQWFGEDEAARRDFIIAVHAREDVDRHDAELNEREQQQLADDDARRRDLAREKVKREKMERRLAGDLDGAARTFLDKFNAELLGIDGMLSVKRPEALIDGLLFKNSLAWLAGPSNTYKSFLALDIVGHAATGRFYHGEDMPMESARSLVIVAEGAGAYGDRIRAWEKHNGPIPRDMVSFYSRAVQLADLDVEMPALLAHAKQQKDDGNGYGLIVFDTQAMCTVGTDENSNTDMGIVMNVLHQLREATGACILLVHHFGSDGAKGMRGATAIYAAATTVIAVKRESDLKVRLSTRAPAGKQKDAEAMDAFLLDLKKVGDADEGWGSLVPTRGTYTPDDEAVSVTGRQRLILQLLLDTETADGQTSTTIARHVSDEQGPRPKDGKPWPASTADSWMKTLVNADLVEKKGARYQITRRGKRTLTDDE